VYLVKEGRIQQQDLENAGIHYGDRVEVRFLDQVMNVPVVREFSEVPSGEGMIRIKDDAVEIGLNMGDFASKYIADKTTFDDGTFEWNYKAGVEGPVAFHITRVSGGERADGYEPSRLIYTDERSDYPNLSDEAFANFRVIETTGMGKGVLYRTASPIDPARHRNTYADAALKKAGVKTVMNLVNTRAQAESFEGYAESYYSTTDYIALIMGMSFEDEDFRNKLAEGLRFFAGHEGPYAIHCLEGKDRTGVVAALLECFMGATGAEVLDDYMITFYNYYGIQPGDAMYERIAKNNIIRTLQALSGSDDPEHADLTGATWAYFRALGLSDEELEALRTNLGK
jgi:hypothetical protein